MKKPSRTFATLAALAVLLLGTALAWGDEDNAKEELALKEAKITLTQAVETALSAVPGMAVGAELDGELSPAVYVVEILNHGQTTEVTLNTQSGEIIKNILDKLDDDDHGGKKADRD